jgi:hypothetical protein
MEPFVSIMVHPSGVWDKILITSLGTHVPLNAWVLIYPEDRSVGSSQLDSGLNPRDGFFINQIVSPIKPVNMRQQQNLLACLDFRTMIEQVIDGHGGPFRNSLLGSHNKYPLATKELFNHRFPLQGRQGGNSQFFHLTLWGMPSPHQNI